MRLVSQGDVSNRIRFEDLPLEIINKVVFWFLNGQVGQDASNRESEFAKYSFIPNSVRFGKCYKSLVSLSSTCTLLRRALGDILFQNVSLVRSNQIDSIMCYPRSLEKFSDKKTCRKVFISELIKRNLENCGNDSQADLIDYPSRYKSYLCMCNFVRYLECDNTSLKNGDLKLFTNLEALKILDECTETPILEHANLSKLQYLAVHARTLMSTPMLLTTLPTLNRLDLFLEYCEIPVEPGIAKIISSFLESTSNKLNELVLILDSPFTIGYSDTISLLSAIAKTSKLRKLTIRSPRRKSFHSLNQDRFVLHPGYSGDELMSLFQNLTVLTIDVPILEALKFHPQTYESMSVEGGEGEGEATTTTTITTTPKKKRKHIAVVDRVITGPHISSHLRETLGLIIRKCGYTSFAFQYGESLEESHLHVLKLVTDFIQWLTNYSKPYYLELESFSLEKCWSVSDDSIIREYLTGLIENGNDRSKVNAATIWGRTASNSPRFRIRDVYSIFYTKECGFPITDSSQYFIGVSDRPRYKANFTRSSEDKQNWDDFWSIETSLCDFEQYSTHRRKSLLFG
ncbi:hypothetical protein KGF56_002938 [Candida oxycetoniae]|uniref:Uncharacterized protein n=1 Tax=Candida oxycetoniae TaxID=497107 RepID=A0AAI9SWS2_9ASCO|nr:uncharacterized protein KGF56_002938 [Candida oxycetoniae]KAI3404299.2 hypothetical protein KGF56_002938 [Candida oxycetoniae]